MSWEKIKDITAYTRKIKVDYWVSETLFSLPWWITLITTLLALTVWIIVIDKARIFEIITYGMIVLIIGGTADRVGVMLGIWKYHHTLTPLPTTIEIHTIIMPIIYMIIYQYVKKWKPFLVVSIVNAVIFAFVLEPLIIELNIYEQLKWKHIYSFLPYIIIAVFCKYVTEKLRQMAHRPKP